MSDHDIISLRVPRQDLDCSSFFTADAPSVNQWVADLAMTNTGQTSRKLYEALAELNRVRMPPDKRMLILEKLRTPINFISKTLSKHYLNQPLVLPQQPRKIAELAQTLHSYLATGYTLVATHTSALGKQAGSANPNQLIAQALHRVICNYSLNIQRHFQLYQPAGNDVWYKLHQFYRLAQQHNVQHQVVIDDTFGSCTVEHCYIRALMMGCSKPNQLRQEDFIGIFKPLTQWAARCQLRPADDHGLFIIDSSEDQPPAYRDQHTTALSSSCLSLNTDKLVEHLKTQREQADSNQLAINSGEERISLDLLNHLIEAWGSHSKRMYMRLQAQDTLEICVGLSATHHYVSGGLSLEALVDERKAKTYAIRKENPFLKLPTQPYRQKDVWDSPYSANHGKTNVSLESIDVHLRDNEQSEQALTKKYPSQPVKMLNASAHGYCLEWPHDAEITIKTGDIIGLKSSQSSSWNIGVIRWVSHNNERTQLGLEFISPSALPYGARIVRKTGSNAEYVRVLILPEIAFNKSPVSLLTPKLPFKTGAKVFLNQHDLNVGVSPTSKTSTTALLTPTMMIISRQYGSTCKQS